MNKDPKQDPTRTKVMRARAAAEMGRRFRNLKGVINTSIVTSDCFGLRPISNVKPTALPPRVLADRPDAAKLEGFMTWLQEQEKKEILEIVPTPSGPETWQSQYIRPAYTKGYATANQQLVQLGALETAATTDQVIASMTLPINSNRLQLIYTQSFEALKGITAQMDAQISTVLAQGLAAGASPSQIAGAINDKVDNIGIVRAKMIARTEVVTAHNMGALSEFEQASGIIGEPVLAQWQATLDGNARPNHLARHGKIFKHKDAVLLLNEPNCLLGDAVIFSPSNLERVFKRHYDGTIIHIKTASGYELTCTPNHPILTQGGFVAAASLDESMHIICSANPDMTSAITENENHIPTRIKDIASAPPLSFNQTTTPGSCLDFHGDGIDGQITVVLSDSGLIDGIKPNANKHTSKEFFAWPHFSSGPLFSDSPFFKVFDGALHSAHGIMCRLNLMLPLCLRHARPLHSLRLALCALGSAFLFKRSINKSAGVASGNRDSVDRHTAIKQIGNSSAINESGRLCDGRESSETQSSGYDLMSNPEFVSKGLYAPLFGEVFLDKIVEINRDTFSGHVYNLQVESGCYFANGIITKNCRCALLPYVESIEGKEKPSKASEFRDPKTGKDKKKRIPEDLKKFIPTA